MVLTRTKVGAKNEYAGEIEAESLSESPVSHHLEPRYSSHSPATLLPTRRLSRRNKVWSKVQYLYRFLSLWTSSVTNCHSVFSVARLELIKRICPTCGLRKDDSCKYCLNCGIIVWCALKCKSQIKFQDLFSTFIKLSQTDETLSENKQELSEEFEN